jgi:hypothetical protein
MLWKYHYSEHKASDWVSCDDSSRHEESLKPVVIRVFVETGSTGLSDTVEQSGRILMRSPEEFA